MPFLSVSSAFGLVNIHFIELSPYSECSSAGILRFDIGSAFCKLYSMMAISTTDLGGTNACNTNITPIGRQEPNTLNSKSAQINQRNSWSSRNSIVPSDHRDRLSRCLLTCPVRNHVFGALVIDPRTADPCTISHIKYSGVNLTISRVLNFP